MAGIIRRRERKSGVRYEVQLDLGPDPLTGKRRQPSRSYKTLKEARVALAQWTLEVEHGRAVAPSQMTMRQLFDDWLSTEIEGQKRANTVVIYRGIVAGHLAPGLGHVAVQKLTAAHVQRFYAAARAAGVGARTLQLCHQKLRQCLRYAVRMRYVTRNVTDDVSAPSYAPAEMQVWDAAEVGRFLRAAQQTPLSPLWLTALTTGLRAGELRGLRWADLDLDAASLRVRQQRARVTATAQGFSAPKSAAGRRVVPLPAQTVAALRRHRAQQHEARLLAGPLWREHDLVFSTGLGTALHMSELWHAFNRLTARARVTPIRIHDLRHTYATHALAAGMPVEVLSRILGHARISMTYNVYVHVITEQRQGAARYIEQAYGLPGLDGGAQNGAQGVPEAPQSPAGPTVGEMLEK